MMTGTAISVEPAMMPPQSVPRLTSVKVDSHSGRVRWSSRVITTRASVNSFQAWMKPKTPVATSPGASSGKVIRKNAWVREQPSIIAASSSSYGTPATKPRRVQIVKGSTQRDVDDGSGRRRC